MSKWGLPCYLGRQLDYKLRNLRLSCDKHKKLFEVPHDFYCVFQLGLLLWFLAHIMNGSDMKYLESQKDLKYIPQLFILCHLACSNLIYACKTSFEGIN